jgi:hypothetical protein
MLGGAQRPETARTLAVLAADAIASAADSCGPAALRPFAATAASDPHAWVRLTASALRTVPGDDGAAVAAALAESATRRAVATIAGRFARGDSLSAQADLAEWDAVPWRSIVDAFVASLIPESSASASPAAWHCFAGLVSFAASSPPEAGRCIAYLITQLSTRLP